MELHEHEWFYKKEGIRQGPVSQEKMLELIQSGALSADDVVCRKGASTWLPVEKTLLGRLSGMDGLAHGEDVNPTMAWLLAFMPLFGRMLYVVWLVVFASLLDSGSGSRYTVWWPVLPAFALYIGLYVADRRNIQKAGYATRMISGWAWIIPPFYLYQRAKCLRQGFIHLYCWIVCFVLMLVL